MNVQEVVMSLLLRVGYIAPFALLLAGCSEPINDARSAAYLENARWEYVLNGASRLAVRGANGAITGWWWVSVADDEVAGERLQICWVPDGPPSDAPTSPPEAPPFGAPVREGASGARVQVTGDGNTIYADDRAEGSER